MSNASGTDDPDHTNPGTNEVYNDTDKLVSSLVYLKEEAKTPESRFIFGRESREHQQEFDRLVDECVDDVCGTGTYLEAYSSCTEKLITDADGESKLQAFQVRIRNHANSFRMFPKCLKMAAIPSMKRQLDMFIADIIYCQKSHNVLAKVVNWEALERELDDCNLQLDTAYGRGRIRDREEPQSAVTVVEYHSPSPKSPPPPKMIYKPPTVEDCDDEEDEALVAAAENKTDALLEEILFLSSEDEPDATPPETGPPVVFSSNIPSMRCSRTRSLCISIAHSLNQSCHASAPASASASVSRAASIVS
ncbi:uncharacterized protein K452DRAFT_301207 [Aplosporella prunicola CBS 121167]|uniref:Uncharacterized protein n=1 Tax=Aplosporella prunicola CBS 121167 TaxID=1176127 RepID=A0A6A6B4C7_9PEZI|nr:uncharacterized protein K452DRAFT_301207 [Aplosporella prunicola CBS 121167]KAF2138243.1 hypothetical protein K452DRAFT_301207 [Aplosporella prunicola CBS 121167]